MRTHKNSILYPALSLLLFIVSSAQAQVKYNIIFITADDMADRLKMFGNGDVLTPNLDRLASRSMVFTNAYVQYPLCSPSRTSYLLGWRPDKTGIIGNKVRPRTVIGPDVKFLPEYFKDRGYRIESYGKTLHHTFESDIAWNYFEPPERKDPEFDGTYLPLAGAAGAGPGPVKWWIDSTPEFADNDGEEARNFVTRLQKSKKIQPYFYSLGFHSVHNPFTPDLEYWNLYGDHLIQEKLPINEFGDYSNVTGNGSEPIILPNTPRNDRSDVPAIAFAGHPSIILSDSDWKRTIHAYDAEVTELDARVGLVLDEVDRQNLWSNTIIIFLSDHGQHLGEHEGTWRKEMIFQEAVHVPLIVYVPVKSPGVCSRIIEYVDIYQTLAELCGLPPPPGTEGTSFAPLFDDPTLPWKKAAFSQVNRRRRTGSFMGRAVCTERFRYISWGEDGEELYDHKNDPHEYTNLVKNPDYLSQLNRMRRILANGWTKAIPPKSSTDKKEVSVPISSASKSGSHSVGF